MIREFQRGSGKELGRSKGMLQARQGRLTTVCAEQQPVKATDITRQSHVELYCLGNASEEPQHPTPESHLFP